jgi:capsular polysaccharide biosynthesis protein
MTMMPKSFAAPGRRKGILNRITDRWWRILLLWIVVSVPLLYLIRIFVESTYQAFSLLQVQPASHELYGDPKSEAVDYNTSTPYLQTQVALITTDRVLTMALTSPEIKNLRFITESDDPRADLRDNLKVQIVKDAYLIRVGLELTTGEEAAKIVNAVIDSYLAYAGDYKHNENSKLRKNLSVRREKIENDIKIKRDELRALYAKGAANAQRNVIALNESGKASDPTRPAFGTVTAELSQQIASEMIKTDLELVKAQASLDAKHAASQGENDLQARQTLAELRQNVASLLKQKEYLAKYFDRVKVDSGLVENDTLDATFINHQLDKLVKIDDQLKTNLEELEFKANQEEYRIVQVDDAKVPNVPTTNTRIKCMIAAPIVVLLFLLGVCLLTPIKDEPLSQSSAKPTPQDEIGS